ncbi:helix-turn-helix domain-containing protein [Burkholderia sp. 8Y]|uniref:helix-turn-helix domain-containing protein n=1 Tax=Burkholderia sp. 8Y TaxID=2653133 RepID=UPI0022A76B0E|nr:helix-turn-helix domain-containing protein [Burkholderia sp. 8Y]
MVARRWTGIWHWTVTGGLGVAGVFKKRPQCSHGSTVHCETISGSTEAFKRPLFAKLVDRRIIERPQTGLARAKAEGVKLGRKSALGPQEQQKVREALAAGVSVSQLARSYSTSRATILRAKVSDKRLRIVS